MKIFVAAYGDAKSRATWSGIPFHLVDGLQRIGIDAEGMTLVPRSRVLSAVWNLGQLLTTGGRGSFKTSQMALRRPWARYHARLKGQAVVNCFQIYPHAVVRDPTIARWYFIDATLKQLNEEFVDYNGPPPQSRRGLARIYEKERRGYAAAEGIVCHSSWAAHSVTADYGIDRAKVHVVVPGANLDLDHYARWRGAHDSGNQIAAAGTGPLRMIFTGRFPEKKGLNRLLEAMRIAQHRGVELHLTVIGCERDDVPDHLRDTPGVSWLGTIDKRTDGDRFNDLLAGAEVGCLLSRHECGGIGLREYAAFGLVVLGPDVGGSPEHAGHHRSVLIARDDTPQQIAEVLVELAARGERFQHLRRSAAQTMDEALYTVVARKVADLIYAT